MNPLFKEELDTFVMVHLDDTLVFLQTLKDHIHHIKIALQKMRDAKVFRPSPQMVIFPDENGVFGLLCFNGRGITKPTKSEDSRRMATTVVSEGRLQLLWPGRIL